MVFPTPVLEKQGTGGRRGIRGGGDIGARQGSLGTGGGHGYGFGKARPHIASDDGELIVKPVNQ